MRRAVFVQAYLPGKEQRRLDVGFHRSVQADGCSLYLGIGQFDLSFFLAHHEHERLCGSLRNDLDVERMGFSNDLSADKTVFFSGKRQFLLFICRAGHSCRDRCSIQGPRFIFVGQPDSQSRLATVFRQQCFQAEVAFLEHGTAMWSLGFALFMVFTIGMPLVIVVALFATLAMVFTVAVSLRFSMAAMPVAIALGGRSFGLAATLQDEGSRADP